MTSLKRATKWYFFGGLLALTLMICWTACVSSTPTPTSTPPLPTSTPTQTVPKEMVESVIPGQGMAISKDDTGLPDEVLTPGEVLFIPEEHAEDLAEAVNLDPANIHLLGRGGFKLDEFQLAELAGTAAVIGADGRFPIDVPAGPYFVCIADIFRGHTAGPPYSVVGCSVIELPNDASLTVSWGEAGFLVYCMGDYPRIRSGSSKRCIGA